MSKNTRHTNEVSHTPTPLEQHEAMIKTHTPTPWSYIVSANGGRLCHVETDMANSSGAGLPVCSIPKAREADAAFIVRAVNAHEEILVALENIRRHANLLAGDLDENSDSHSYAIAIRDEASKAIAKAEGK